MQILLIEDTESIIKGLVYSFEHNEETLIVKTTLKEARTFLETHPPLDLIILDITLPDGNGLSFFESTIKHLQIPTIFLTADDEEDTIVKGLTMGAEDYITKPFSTKELMARVHKVLLRNQKQSRITIQDISLDLDKMIFYKKEEKIELTPLELKLLHFLFMNLNKVVYRTTLLDKVWEWTGNYVDDHTITVYFKRIRQKIKTDIIKTIKGIGYRIDEE